MERMPFCSKLGKERVYKQTESKLHQNVNIGYLVIFNIFQSVYNQ